MINIRVKMEKELGSGRGINVRIQSHLRQPVFYCYQLHSDSLCLMVMSRLRQLLRRKLLAS